MDERACRRPCPSQFVARLEREVSVRLLIEPLGTFWLADPKVSGYIVSQPRSLLTTIPGDANRLPCEPKSAS